MGRRQGGRNGQPASQETYLKTESNHALRGERGGLAICRLLYCLLGSTLFHGALIWAPLPMNAGSAGEDALQPVRVELVDAPRYEAPRQVARQPVLTERPKAASPAKATKTPPKPKRPRAPARPVIRVAKAVPTASKRVHPTPARTRPAKTRPEQPRPEPAPSPEPTGSAKPPEDTRPVNAAAPAWEPAAGNRGNVGAVTEEHLTRGLAKKTSPDRGLAPGAGFSPARYARTVPPRYPGKARRAGWEGTTVIKVRVDPKGAPDRVAVDRTSGFDILDAAAVKAVRRWKFHPARRGLDAVPSWVRIPVAFKLKEDKR